MLQGFWAIKACLKNDSTPKERHLFGKYSISACGTQLLQLRGIFLERRKLNFNLPLTAHAVGHTAIFQTIPSINTQKRTPFTDVLFFLYYREALKILCAVNF